MIAARTTNPYIVCVEFDGSLRLKLAVMRKMRAGIMKWFVIMNNFSHVVPSARYEYPAELVSTNHFVPTCLSLLLTTSDFVSSTVILVSVASRSNLISKRLCQAPVIQNCSTPYRLITVVSYILYGVKMSFALSVHFSNCTCTHHIYWIFPH